MQPTQIVSTHEWLAARTALLAKEKAHMRAGDALAAERRALPWLKIEKSYPFDTELGRRSLTDLFQGCEQLRAEMRRPMARGRAASTNIRPTPTRTRTRCVLPPAAELNPT